jgi:Asp-tRNA(Asn)/Glu-tRNA(Gln) amidotransferase A subunit family amidase
MIPFVQTNVPQIGMTCETHNNLWGRSLNPWNKSRSPGGSSGGEGAMISARCSILGVGSDNGGSIRIPA